VLRSTALFIRNVDTYPQTGEFKKEFQEADTNHDGYVTREEAKAYYASKEGSPN